MKRIVEELKNYRIFAKLRPNTIARIYHYLSKKEFHRGQVIYREGDSNVDYVYFITSGEFEVTKNVQKIDPGLTDDNGDPTALEKKIRKSPIKSKKVKDMMRSKSTGMVMQLGSLDSSANHIKRLIPTY